MRPRPRAVVSVLVVLFAIGAASCASDGPGRDAQAAPAGAAAPKASERPAAGTVPKSLDGVSVRLTPVAKVDGLATSLAASADGKELLVGERSGLVGRVRLERRSGHIVPVGQTRAILDLRSRVATAGEQGLLGLAIDRSGAHLLVAYTAIGGNITVEAFPFRSGRAVDSGRGRTILSVPHPFYDNNGGDLQVTKSGDVLVSIGDMGTGKSSDAAAQDPTSPLGKVLRLRRSLVEGSGTAAVPDLKTSTVASGLRNPWRLALDADNGDLWIADVGEKETEEVDLVPAEDLGAAPANFGWPYYEGSTRFRGTPPKGADLTSAVLERGHGKGVCAVVGGRVYRGRAIPALYGAYLYSDTCSAEVRALVVERGKVVANRVIARSPVAGAISFGADRSGELYLLDAAGTISRLDPSSWKVDSDPKVVAVATGKAPDDTTSTSAPTADPENCALIADFQHLSDVESLSPAEVQALFGRILDQLGQIEDQVPAGVRDDLLLIRSQFTALSGRLAALGWDVSSPAFASTLQQATRGEGDYEGLAQALSALLPPLAVGCPSD